MGAGPVMIYSQITSTEVPAGKAHGDAEAETVGRTGRPVAGTSAAESWPVLLNPWRFRSDEARMRVLAQTAGILSELEEAVRRELGADAAPKAEVVVNTRKMR
jgi:hypothetical protein